MAKAARAPRAPKVKAGDFMLIAINKHSGGPLHIKCESLEAAHKEAKQELVDRRYPIYARLPTGEFHVISQP